MSTFPRIFRVRQRFSFPRVDNVAQRTTEELVRLRLGERVRTGQSVAITAGSRGIAHINEIIKACVDHLKGLGATPFIVPSMGSHGGGTAEGQTGILAGYGITPQTMGCEIRSSMDTVTVCQASEGFPVHFDRHAFGADHVLVVGRVKPHTGFVGEVESGLMKMLLIGLGKHEGAKIYHRAIMNFSFGQIIRSVAREVLAKCRILAGLAIVENGYDETALIEGVQPENFESREPELLVLAREWLPKLPFERVELLIVDQLGKDVSGAGMDTNVIGRKYSDHAAREDEWPKVKRIFVRDLTPGTHGNATGIGIAEFCRKRVIEKMDVIKTRINCLTGGHPTAAMVPLDYETDREALDTAFPTIGLTEPVDSRLLWIRNTLHVREVECSEKFFGEAKERDDLEIVTDPRPMPFDASNNLPDGFL